MKPKYFHTMHDALCFMHKLHGGGDVIQTRIFGDGRFEIEVKSSLYKSKIIRGRLINNKTIKMYKRQMAVCIVGGDRDN